MRKRTLGLATWLLLTTFPCGSASQSTISGTTPDGLSSPVESMESVSLPKKRGQAFHSTNVSPGPAPRRALMRAAAPGTLPFWSDSFAYRELHFGYSMIGTDPRLGSATTVVPSLLIPMRFVFSDGHIYDVSTDPVDGLLPIPAIVNSPIFQNHDYVIGGTDVGNTQFGDAFQRANFWNSVSTISPNYHVLIGAPTIAAVQTINVPNGKFGYLMDPGTQQVFPVVESQYLGSSVGLIMQNLGVGPQTLPIFMTGVVSPDNSWGYHFVRRDGTNRTGIVAPYLHHDVAYYGQHVPDLFVLSHEIVEWMDDPFVISTTPGWQFAGDPHVRCDLAFLEVGDPFVFYDPGITAIQTNSTTYHVTDAAFVDFFTRNPSRSVNGQFSFFASVKQATPPCVGMLEPAYVYITFPGSLNTFARGINNAGTVAGYYQTANRKSHGYLYRSSGFIALDYPGAIETFPYGINDGETIVGSFKDSQAIEHGFLYKSGQWSAIDAPAAISTVATGINTAGDIVGYYKNAVGATHGFVLRGGKFDRIATAKHTANLQVFGINDSNILAAVSSPDVSNGPYTAYSGIQHRLPGFSFPESRQTILYGVNNSNDVAGYFIDPNGYFAPLFTIHGLPYFGDTSSYPYTYPHGYNDSGQITGDVGDPGLDGTVGFIGKLPIASSRGEQKNEH